MPVSPQEFSLWAKMTGRKYPNSLQEKAELAPEVHIFNQNVGKQGGIGVNEVEIPNTFNSSGTQTVETTSPTMNDENPENKENLGSNLGSKLAKSALIAGGLAAGVAAARNPGVQEVVKNTSEKIGDFISKFTDPREINIDTLEAAQDITNSAPSDIWDQADVYSQTRPFDGGFSEPNIDPWAGPETRSSRLLRGTGIGGAGDKATALLAEISEKYPESATSGEYVHPSRISGMPGGDYRGRRITYSPEQKEAFNLTKQEADTRAILGNEGEIPPGMLTKEQQAYLKLNELGGETLQAGKKRDLANVEASGESGVSGGSGGTGQKNLSGQADDFIGKMQGPMPPEISLKEANSMQEDRHSMEREYRDKFILENREAIERGDIDPYSEQHFFNQPSLSDIYPNPWAEDHEDIIRDAVRYEGATGYKDRDRVSGYKYADIQDKLNELSGKVDPARQEILDIVSTGEFARGNREAMARNVWEANLKEKSLSEKADAVVDAIVESHSDFGNVTYNEPEAIESAKAHYGENPVNTALISPNTPGNSVVTIDSTNDPTTSTGQHQIKLDADNIVDNFENDVLAIKRAELGAKRAQIAENTGLSNPAVDRFLGQYFPSMTETYSDVDIASGRTPERTFSNVGPEAEITKAASGGAIRGRSRVQDYEVSQDRTRDISPEPEELRGTPLAEQRPDIIGGKLALGGVPGDLDTDQMSKQEVIQSIINPSTVDLRDKTPIAGTGVYGREKGYVSGAMKASGDYSDAAMRKPTDLSPAETRYDSFIKDPYGGLSDKALETHIQSATPDSPSQKGLEREAYKRSGTGIPISQKMREIHTTGDPLTRSERAQTFLDELDPTGELRKRNLG